MPTQRFALNAAGVAELERAIRRNLSGVVASVRDQLPDAARELMGTANGAVPVDSGALRSSSFVPEGVGGRKRASIAPGYLHELAPAIHEGFHGGRKFRKIPSAHWFTRALFDYAPRFRTWMEGALRRAVGS